MMMMMIDECVLVQDAGLQTRLIDRTLEFCS